jgi:hypothetical protein
MLKKLSTLLFLFALCMWAADFWATKPFTDWSDKEAIKVLTDSPWVGKTWVSWGQPPGGNRCGGGFGGELPGKDGRNVGEAVPPFACDATVTLLWQTALPVKQALALRKRRFAEFAGTSQAAKAFPDVPEQFYVLELSGVPGNLLAATQGDKKAGLLDITTLTAGGKPPLKAVDVITTLTAGGKRPLKAVDVPVFSTFGGPVGTVSFLFPKTTTFTADDKDLEFSTKFDKTAVKYKFKLKDMVFHGKVEM